MKKKIKLNKLLKEKKEKKQKVKRNLNFILPLSIRNLLSWLNHLENTKLAFFILVSFTTILFITHSIFIPEINASSTTVMEIIHDWNNKVKAIAVLTLGLLYHRVFLTSWVMYQKKPQGKATQ